MKSQVIVSYDTHRVGDVVTIDSVKYVITGCDGFDRREGGHQYKAVPINDICDEVAALEKEDNNLKRNKSGYPDPTAYQAIRNVDTDYARFKKVLDTIHDICYIAGFYVEERVVLKDKKTGKVWR